MSVLTLVDVLQIQRFIFSSNRLRDIIAGSEMVKDATGRKLIESIAGSGKVVFAAGGNVLLSFETIDAAKAFAAKYSRRLIDDFPGLEVVLAHVDDSSCDWFTKFDRAQRELLQKKLSMMRNAPVMGLSVTAECKETRAVATHRYAGKDSQTSEPISSAVASRRRGSVSDDSWSTYLVQSEYNGKTLKFPADLDHLGRTAGESSLIGIVHIDGNSVGHRIIKWRDALPELTEVDAQERQRRLSEEISDVGENVMRAVVSRVVNALAVIQEGSRQIITVASSTGSLPLHVDEKSSAYLPIRPLIVGGDDITFVCDGRIAIDLAAAALKEFRSLKVSSFNSALGAAAGIAIVKSHAPIYPAVQLSEHLCKSAKEHLKKLDRKIDDYALDWHIGYQSLLEDLQAYRRRNYTPETLARGSSLTMRPYIMEGSESPSSFEWLTKTILGGTDGFLSERWQRHRNKIKELREIVRRGSVNVDSTYKSWRITSNVPNLPGGLGVNGFIDDRTPLLDAVELLDLYYSLN